MKRLCLAWIGLLVAAPSFAAAQPQPIEAPGTWVHEAARADFPAEVGRFRRTSLVRYDDAGVNVSASYSLRWPEGRLHVTVYIYPAARTPAATPDEACRREYGESSDIIGRQHAGAVRIEAGDAPVLEGAAGHRSAYRFISGFDGREQEVRSELILYCLVGGTWQVKYRATAPAVLDTAADLEVFIRAGPWPGRTGRAERVAATAAGGGPPARAGAAR
jgi:hypothetical protein